MITLYGASARDATLDCRHDGRQFADISATLCADFSPLVSFADFRRHQAMRDIAA